MPVSMPAHISRCVSLIVEMQPRSVLDIGMGFGLWGFLCREYLDVFPGRVWPEQWEVRIDGIELFEPYIMAHQRAIYSNIIIGDIRKLAPTLDHYDLIIAGDVIEHLDKDDGEDVVDALYDKADRALMVNIPLGENWDHPETYGNPGELHRSVWHAEDFYPYPHVVQFYEVQGMSYGAFYCPKTASPAERATGHMNAAHFHESIGDAARALRHARRAVAVAPEDPDPVMLLADLLLRAGDHAEAIAVLRHAAESMPGFERGRLLTARLLAALSCRAEAVAELDRLLECDTIDPSLREEAEALRAGLVG